MLQKRRLQASFVLFHCAGFSLKWFQLTHSEMRQRFHLGLVSQQSSLNCWLALFPFKNHPTWHVPNWDRPMGALRDEDRLRVDEG